MSDQLSINETGSWGCHFHRWSTTEPPRKISEALDTIALTVTAPDGTTTAYTLASFRNPEVGRYELDRVCDQAGDWVGDWVVTAAWTDEDSLSRSYTGTKQQIVRVAAT